MADFYDELLSILGELGFDERLLRDRLINLVHRGRGPTATWNLDDLELELPDFLIVEETQDDYYVFRTARCLHDKIMFEIIYAKSLNDCLPNELRVNVILKPPRSLEALLD